VVPVSDISVQLPAEPWRHPCTVAELPAAPASLALVCPDPVLLVLGLDPVWPELPALEPVWPELLLGL